jgi:quinol monooxygenase YgiN
MAHITLTGFLIARTLDEADRIAANLPEHIRLTRAEPGCLGFEVVRSQSDPCRFAVTETFTDRAAFQAHQARTAASPWARITAGIPRDYTIAGRPPDTP